MIDPKKLPNGKLLVPRRAEGPGGMIGDGLVEIGPDDPEYADWLAWIEGTHPIDAGDMSSPQFLPDPQV